MNFQKQIIITFLFFYSSVYSQIPIHKIEMDCRKNIDYRLQNKRSNILIIDSLSLIQKLTNEKSISDFAIKDKPEISLAITSLDVIKIKSGRLNFNKFKQSKYKPDKILNEFIVKNLSFESFINLNKKKTYKIGVYMFWNFKDSLRGIEFVELKDNKYYLIYKMVQKNR